MEISPFPELTIAFDDEGFSDEHIKKKKKKCKYNFFVLFFRLKAVIR
jgi:hypothetical protein